MHRKNKTVRNVTAVCISVLIAMSLAGCLKQYTFEDCVLLMDKYLSAGPLNKITCRAQFNQLSQIEFNNEMSKLEQAVSSGRTMEKDLQSGINQLKSDLGL